MRRRRVAIGAMLLAGLAGIVAVSRPKATPVLRTIALDRPYGLALDAPLGRAFVIGVNSGYRGYAATLDTASGALLHTASLGANPTDMAIDEHTKRVFVTDIVDGTVSMLDARSGALLHTVAVGEMQPHDIQRIVIDSRTNRVFVSTSPVSMPNPSLSAVQVLDARTGALLHTTAAGGSSLTVDEQTGRVFVANLSNNSVSMLDAHSGALLSTVFLGTGTGALHLAVSLRTGRVFAATDAGVTMLDAWSGRVLHTLAITGERNAELLVDDAAGRIIATDYSPNPPYSGNLRLLDARSGATISIFAGPYLGIATVDGRSGHIFTAVYNTVRMLDVTSGTVLHATIIEPSSSMVVDEHRGRVLVVSPAAVDSNGNALSLSSVKVLDARDGTLLGTISVGVNAGPLAIDERTGHAFVVDSGGPVRALDPWSWVPRWLRRWMPFLPAPGAGIRIAPGSVMMLDTSRL